MGFEILLDTETIGHSVPDLAAQTNALAGAGAAPNLVEALHAIAEALDRLSAQIATTPMNPPTTTVPAWHATLTRREVDVIRLMAHGETNNGIARKLTITVGTAKTHVKSIMRKLEATNRAEAVARWLTDQASTTRH